MVFSMMALIALAALLAGCASGTGFDPMTDISAETAEPVADMAALAPQSGPAAPALSPPGTLMIYDAHLSLVVVNMREAQKSIRAVAEQHGGYMQSMDARAVIVRVPAKTLDQVIAAIEQLGDVTAKEIAGHDVTDQMRDLTLRLKNAEDLRTRLAALLDRATNVTEAITIEKELARLTETIEQLKGQFQLLQNKVAYSTVTVHLNSPVPQQAAQPLVPFAWVAELAGDMSRGNRPATTLVADGTGVDFVIPDGFAKYYERAWLTQAVSADGVYLKVTRQDNVKGATLEYWATVIKRTLESTRGLAMRPPRSLILDDDEPAMLLDGVKQFSGLTMGYLVAITATKRHVYIFEAWGPQASYDADMPALETSIRSMDVGWFADVLF